MKVRFYLTVSSTGNVKLTKKAYAVSMREVCIGCSLDLPDTLFTRPKIEATIKVEADKVNPFSITADTSNMVKEAIQQFTGLEVELTIINPEPATAS